MYASYFLIKAVGGLGGETVFSCPTPQIRHMVNCDEMETGTPWHVHVKLSQVN